MVEKGSLARFQWESKAAVVHTYSQLHAQLKRAGILCENGDHSVFTENYAFQSPSAAAAVINGRPANGTIEWRLDGTGETYKDWESRNLGIAEEPRDAFTETEVRV